MAYDGTNNFSEWDVSKPGLTELGNILGIAIQEAKRVTQAVVTKEHGSDGTHAAGVIVTGYIADDAVTTAKIVDGAVTSAKLAAGAVGTGQIGAGSITSTQLAADSVTATQIAAGAVGTSEIAASAVTVAKMGGATSGVFLIGQAGGGFLQLALSGAISVNATTGVVSLANSNAVSIATIQDLKADGTAGGTFTSGSLVRRDLNSLNDPSALLVSLSANIFTLPFGGKYMFWAEVPAYVTGDHQAVLYDETNAAVKLPGSNCSNGNSSPDTSRSVIMGYIDLSTATANVSYSIKHQCSVTEASDGLGKASSFTVTSEVYTQAMLIKIG